MHQRSIDNLLVGIQLIVAGCALAVGTRSYYFSAGLVGVLALHMVLGIGLPIRPTVFTELLFAVPFAIWFRNLPLGGFTGLPPIDLLFMFGYYSLALGTHHLIASRVGGSRLQAMAAGIIAMTLAGTAQRTPIFLPLVCLFVPLVMLELRRSLNILSARLSTGQWARLVAALAMMLAMAMAVQHVISVHLPPLNRWVTQRLDMSVGRGPGFSRVAHLGNVADSWSRGDDQQIVLRQFSDRPASHLRAIVYDRYKTGSWDAIPDEPRDVRPRGEEAGRRVFDLTPAASIELADDAGPISMIYPEPSLSEDFFMPLGTRRLSAFCKRLQVTRVLTARSPERLAGGGYGVHEARPDTAPPGAPDLDVPYELRPALRTICQEILAEQASGPNSAGPLPATIPSSHLPPAQVTAAIATYFEHHFTYRVGIQLSGEKDPVLEFLRDLKAGHCEYFASSAVLLMRTMGVPARYVTGFVCIEPALGNAYHIARRKDAHAWVEFYVAGRGWTTFDPTPPGARPPAANPSYSNQILDRFAANWRRVWSIVAYGGLLAVVSLAWSWALLAIEAVPTPAWALILVMGLLWTFRQRIRSTLRGPGPDDPGPRVRELRKKLALAERLLRRHGVERGASTAVGDFLTRVRQAPLPPEIKQQAESLLGEFQACRYRLAPGPGEGGSRDAGSGPGHLGGGRNHGRDGAMPDGGGRSG